MMFRFVSALIATSMALVAASGTSSVDTVLKDGGVVELGPFNAATLQRVETLAIFYFLQQLLQVILSPLICRRRLMDSSSSAATDSSSSAVEGCRLPDGNDDLMQQISTAQIRNLYGHFENKEDFSTDELLSIYLSYVSEDKANEAIAAVDTNNDGILDQDELEHMTIPEDFVEFVFTDILACAAEKNNNKNDIDGDGEQDCMTAQAAIDFLNAMFHHEVVDADLAAHIKESAGEDACFAREEFLEYSSPQEEQHQESKDGSSSAPFFAPGIHLALVLFFCLILLH